MVEQNQVNQDYEAFIGITRKRRSVRRFEKGRSISSEVLERITADISKDMEVERHTCSGFFDTYQ